MAWVSPDDGWLAVDLEIVGTDDAGVTWRRLSRLDAEVRHLDFVNLDDGWAATAKGIFATSDGGRTWTRVPAGAADDFLGVDFVDDGEHGWAMPKPPEAPGKALLLGSADGGKTWTQRTLPCDTRFARFAVSFFSQSDGWFVCPNTWGAGSEAKLLYRTTDAATTWRLVGKSDHASDDPKVPVGLPLGGYVASLHFRDETHGWIAATRRGLIHTTDGGRTWRDVSPVQDETFPRKVHFFSEERGYVLRWASGQAVVLDTRDSGATWRQVYPAPVPTPQ